MIRFVAIFLPVLFAVFVPAFAVNSNPAAARAPIVNFSLPMFSGPEGFRAWLIRGSEAWMPEANTIDVKELSLTVFSGDASNRIDTMLLSPAAHVLTDQKIATGTSTVRVINLRDGFEASGENWHFAYKDQSTSAAEKNHLVTVTLAKKVRVVLRAEFKNYLK